MTISLWEQVWLSQDRKCAECGSSVELNDTAKSSYSFEISCRTCYDRPSSIMVIYDEFSTWSEVNGKHT